MKMTNIENGTGLMALQLGGLYCSLPSETKEDKTLIYNASNNPNHRIAEFVNKTIKVVGFILEKVEMTSQETGDIRITPRTILIDTDGQTYVAVSIGVANALAKVCNLFGMPNEWDEPIEFAVKQIEKNNHRILTLEML